jgi:hypothetical protein
MMIVILKKASILRVDNTVLMPGANVVDAKWWKEVRPRLIEKIEGETPELIEEQDVEQSAKLSTQKQKEADAAHLTTLKPHQAVALVKETTSVELLNTWKAGEKRDSVLKAIKSQIAEIEKPIETRDRGTIGKAAAAGQGKAIEVTLQPSATGV